MSELCQGKGFSSFVANHQEVQIDICIPGYTPSKQAQLIKLKLIAKQSKVFTFESRGNVANALAKVFKRNIEIISSLKQSYSKLKTLQYRLLSPVNNMRVRDARSAGLPISIALINVLRQLNGLEQVQRLIGTGVLRIDGTFEQSFLEEEKKQASSQIMENKFITSQVCKHVFDLATLMNEKLIQKERII